MMERSKRTKRLTPKVSLFDSMAILDLNIPQLLQSTPPSSELVVDTTQTKPKP